MPELLERAVMLPVVHEERYSPREEKTVHILDISGISSSGVGLLALGNGYTLDIAITTGMLAVESIFKYSSRVQLESETTETQMKYGVKFKQNPDAPQVDPESIVVEFYR